MEVMGVRRTRLHIAPPFLRAITVTLDFIFPGLPISAYWLDYLAVNRTDLTPRRAFNMIPGDSGSIWITCAARNGGCRWVSC
jgi:hypothetical protein